MTVKKNLAQFYDTEAKKYAQTRQKPRHEVKEIFAKVTESQKSSKRNKKYKILELGCGSGRFTQQEEFSKLKNIDYTGVDISEKLLKFAQDDYNSSIKGRFVTSDMLSFMKEQKQETADAILAFASFQHIPSKEERTLLMHYFYQTLNYGGVLIVTNWAFSKWFRSKYHEACRKSLIKWVYSLGKHDFRDVLVPWKGKDKEFARFYHLYSKSELKQLTEQAGFIIEELNYIDKKGQNVDSAKYANNTILIARKSIYNNKI